MYHHGLGVKQDYSKAAKLYLQAANKRNDLAAYNLAILYQHGRGVEQSYHSAIYYYRLSASEGNDDALISLGFLYLHAQSVENYQKAYEVFLEAAQKGNQDAKDFLSCHLEPKCLHDLSDCVKNNICTKNVTGDKYLLQRYYRCHTCDSNEEGEKIVICQTCVKSCHKGHLTSDYLLSDVSCECSAKTICLSFKK